MAEDADDGKDHAGEVAVCISHEDLGWVPVVPPERKRHPNEGEEDVEREEMRVRCWVRIRLEEIEAVVQHDQECDYQ